MNKISIWQHLLYLFTVCPTLYVQFCCLSASIFSAFSLADNSAIRVQSLAVDWIIPAPDCKKKIFNPADGFEFPADGISCNRA